LLEKLQKDVFFLPLGQVSDSHTLLASSVIVHFLRPVGKIS
jgi:hypothetical protein